MPWGDALNLRTRPAIHHVTLVDVMDAWDSVQIDL